MNGARNTLVVAGVAWAALALAGTAPAESPARASSRGQDAFLRTLSRQASGEVGAIVTLRRDFAPADEQALRRLGGSIYRHLPLVRAVAVRLPRRNLDRLGALPFVAHLSADVSVRKTDEFTVWHSGAPGAWAQRTGSGAWLTGAGVGVAVVDSGVDPTSLDLQGALLGVAFSRVVAQANFVAGERTNDDDCGHGTHVAGIIAGNGAESNLARPVIGIAPGASIVSVRVLNRVGQGTVSDAIAGIQWVVKNRNRYNIRVLNFSAGHGVGDSVDNDPLCQAMEQAWKAGITVVCSAGNAGRRYVRATPGMANEGYGSAYGSIQSPGNSPYVITVGAMKCDDSRFPRPLDRIATYSSRGPSRLDYILKPDLVAPGNRVISLSPYVGNGLRTSYLYNEYTETNTVPRSYFLWGAPGKAITYFYLSGTSMAAPVVAGAAALLLQKDPTLSPDTIKARLMVSAEKWTDGNGNGDPCTYGAGYLDIPAALASKVKATKYALSPALKRSSDGRIWLIGGDDLWGIRVSDLTAIWGDKAIWGSGNWSLVDSDKAIWGSGLWGDKAIWGSDQSAADLSRTAVFGE